MPREQTYISEIPPPAAQSADIVDGYLNPGDRITIRLGDRRGGGPGTRTQTFEERSFVFRAYVDPLGASKFAAVPGDVTIDFVAGPPAALSFVTPSPCPRRRECACPHSCFRSLGLRLSELEGASRVPYRAGNVPRKTRAFQAAAANGSSEQAAELIVELLKVVLKGG